jgi:cold shock protein
MRHVGYPAFAGQFTRSLPINYYLMKNGIVKFFNESKGFGFIKEAESEKDYFVHSSGLKERIKENDEVTFDLEQGKKGLNAVNVKLA